MVISISASMPYQHQSHEELRWENYKQGNKGSSRANPSTRILASRDRPQGNMNYSTFGQPNAAFSCFSNPNRSSFASPHTTLFASDCKSPVSSEGGVPKLLFNERAPETIVVTSSTSSGCTACGAKTSSSPFLNSATTPPPPPPSSAASSAAMFYPVLGSYPLMFSTTLAGQGTYLSSQGATLAGQGASPGIHQAYPLVQCYILLPFGAMSLQ